LNVNTNRKSSDRGNADSEWIVRVVRAVIIPECQRKGAKDSFRGDRPLICRSFPLDGTGPVANFLLCLGWTDEGSDGGSLLYSISRHQVVRRMTVAERAVEFQANEDHRTCANLQVYFI
jgi:hypothetical protein